MSCRTASHSTQDADISGHRPAPEIVELGVPEEELHGAQVLGTPVDQSRLGPAHRVRAVARAVQPHFVDPVPEDAGVLGVPRCGES
jgi:hypothetical protein